MEAFNEDPVVGEKARRPKDGRGVRREEGRVSGVLKNKADLAPLLTFAKEESSA